MLLRLRRVFLAACFLLALSAPLGASPPGTDRDQQIAVFPAAVEAVLHQSLIPIWGREEGVVIAGPSHTQLDVLRAQGIEPRYSAPDNGEALHILSHDGHFNPPAFAGVLRFKIHDGAMLYLFPPGLEMELPRLKLHALFHGVPRVPLLPVQRHPADTTAPPISTAPSALVQQIVNATSQPSWFQFVRDLSGDSDVTIPGSCTACRIRTRASNYMFPPKNTGNPLGNPFATEYLLYKGAGWGFTGPNAAREAYTSANSGCVLGQGSQTWQNVVFTLPAQVDYAQSQQVIFVVHYDSISESGANDANNSTGADDAISGGSALLEAMRLFKGYGWQYPVKFLFVSGEELGLCGSTAYTRQHPTAPMWRVLNMDQTAYDGNKNGLMNLYNWSTAACPSCVAFGDAFVQANSDYGNIIDPAKIVRNQFKMCQTDHCPFWNAGVTAIDLNEDLTNNDICPCFDGSQTPTCRDTVTQLYPLNGATLMFDQNYSWPTEKAAIALIAHTAQPLYACPASPAVVSGTGTAHQVQLTWPAVPPVTNYVVERAAGGCGGIFAGIASVATASYTDNAVNSGATYGYRIRTCPFQLSNCVAVTTSGASVTYQAGSAAITAESGGDGDLIPDNCELVTARINLVNNGNVPLTTVSLSAASSTSAAVQIASGVPQSVGNLAVGASAPASFQFYLGRSGASAACGEPLHFNVTAQSTEAPPSTGSFAVTAEQDRLPGPLSYGFETDLSGWTVNAGSFTRVAGGASGSTAFSLHSRTPVINNDCNSVLSPVITPTAASTMTMQVNYGIENGNHDRAVVRAVNVATGVKTLLVPTGAGYNTTGSENGLCDGLGGLQGWSGNHATWRQASFNLGAFAGAQVQIEVRFSTDAATVRAQGFWMDAVTITGATQLGCDGQSNVCSP